MVTAEEHSIVGGLGGAVSEYISQVHPVPIEFVGVYDTFVETGLNHEYLLDHFGMSVENIIKAAKKVFQRKNEYH